MRKFFQFMSVMVVLLNFSLALAQEDDAPFTESTMLTATECRNNYPCAIPSKAVPAKARRVQKRAPSYRTDPEVVRRIEVLETETQEIPAHVVQETPITHDITAREWEEDCPPPSPPPPVTSAAPIVSVASAPIARNYIAVNPISAPAESQVVSNTRFGLEIGGLATIHSSWWETSPGVYGAARLAHKNLVLSIESGYQKIIFHDGSTIEDVYVEPTIGYEFGRGSLQFVLSGGVGFWTTLEDWISPICGRNDCGQGTENAITASLTPGLTLNITRALKLSFNLPVRWISSTPSGMEWTLGVKAGLGIFTL